mmetsp:Transcript_43887/g.115873  ORF Transcript_43887/g.115873 Transcript_43887/m.115873 type:complete len:325 (-) Transcript_43887:195-1169(-)
MFASVFAGIVFTLGIMALAGAAGHSGVRMAEKDYVLGFEEFSAGPCYQPPDDFETLRKQKWPLAHKNKNDNPIGFIAYMNLDKDQERRELVEDHGSKMPGSPRLIRVPAVNVSFSFTDPRFQSMRDHGWNEDCDGNVEKELMRAISMSHSLALGKLMEFEFNMTATSKLAMVIEDDSILLPDLQHKVAELLDYTPETWEILRIGWFGNRSYAINEHVDYCVAQYCATADGEKVPLWYGAHAYLVKPGSLGAAKALFDKTRVFPADLLISSLLPPHETPTKYLRPVKVFASRESLVEVNWTLEQGHKHHSDGGTPCPASEYLSKN